MSRRRSTRNLLGLKHLNWREKRLADGRVAVYYYAWKGGPPLPGNYGSDEFLAAYYAASRDRKEPPQSVLFSILAQYQRSEDFLGLARRTREDYVGKTRLIEKEFGDFPLSALTDRRARAEFLAWRDKLAASSRRQADYAWTVLARVLSWAKGRELTLANPCERGGRRLYRANRVDKIWTDADEADFLAAAPKHLHLPLMLAVWTGLRQGDILTLPWSAYDGVWIRLRSGRSNRRLRLDIPVGAPLRALLDTTERQSPVIVLNTDGRPWTEDGFRSSWRKACAKAGISGLTFHDLRGTAVTRLALAGCTEAEIATITGHALRAVRSILDSHYLCRDPALAESAIRKLETRTKIPDRTPDCA